MEKWEKGRIPAAMFSDLLRVELLIKYGGTWIDSTVLCTGVNDEKGSLREKSEENLLKILQNQELENWRMSPLNLKSRNTLNLLLTLNSQH